MNFSFNSKFEFFPPSQTKILILDQFSEQLVKKDLKIKNFNSLLVRGEVINLPILILCLIKFKFTSHGYIINYIKISDPKVVITFIDNSIFFYKLKKIFPKIKFIAVQNGNRRNFWDMFDSLKDNKSKLKADYIFTFGRAIAKTYSKYIKFKNFSIGSFKNNFVPLRNKKVLQNNVLFISNFRKNLFRLPSFYNIEPKLLPLISKFCKKAKLKINILGCSKNHELEKKYYSSILNDENFNFFKKKNYPENYKILDKFGLIIFIDSTLGYEAIARGKKVAIFSARRGSENGPKYNFGWPKKIKNKDFFYTNTVTESEVFRVLKNVTKCKKTIWIKKTRKIFDGIMNYDFNNKTLRKIIFSSIN